tara:strand:+ start:1936 stop:2223 length:288 start_codon:yes stop_codon:yes gene_type:complete
MSEEIKFTEEEMKQVSEIRQKYVTIQNSFGQISINRLRLNQQNDDLDKAEQTLSAEFMENQNSERDFVDGINKKYGDGNLDINTGVFTKSQTENK